MDTQPPVATPVEFLLVEDDPRTVRQIHDALARDKVRNRVRIARNGAVALRLLREGPERGGARPPDVILVDFHIAGALDGFTLMAELTADSQLRQIPLVVLVGSAAERDLLRDRGMHACCILTRPLDLRELAKVVQARQDLALTMVRGDAPGE